MSSTSTIPTSRSTLPAPTGTHPIGRISTECEDRDRVDPYAPDPSTPRHLVLWIWYPADPTSSGAPADFLPRPWTPIADQLGVDVNEIHTHAVADAPAADRRSPVLLLSPSGFSPLFLGSIAEELASHGYVVVGVNHTYETAVTVFSDGHVATMNPAALGGALGPQIGPHDAAFRRRAEVCNYKAADLRSSPTTSAGSAPTVPVSPAATSTSRRSARSDTPSVATQRSSGAAPTNDAEPRPTSTGRSGPRSAPSGCPAPPSRSSLTTPSSRLTGADAVAAGIVTDPAWHDAERMLARDGWRNIDRLASPGHTARIAGSTHMSFMDIPFLAVQPGSPVAAMLAATSIRPERMWRLTSDLLLAFFAEHLDGFSDPVDGFPGTDQPEVSIGPP